MGGEAWGLNFLVAGLGLGSGVYPPRPLSKGLRVWGAGLIFGGSSGLGLRCAVWGFGDFSHKVLLKPCCKSRFPHKSVNLLIMLVIVDTLTDLYGN